MSRVSQVQARRRKTGILQLVDIPSQVCVYLLQVGILFRFVELLFEPSMDGAAFPLYYIEK
jgi:hypothetical protein